MDIQSLPLNVEKFSSVSSHITSLNKDRCIESADPGFKIRKISSKDRERVLHFLRRFFFRDEPLNVAVDLLGESPDTTCEELEDFSLDTIDQGTSLMAVSNSGALIGVCLNGIHERDDVDDCSSNFCQNPKFKKILRLLEDIDREGKVFEQFPEVDRILEVKIISVDGSWRGLGIASALIAKTRSIAKEMGFNLLRVDCTSHYSARAVAKLGMECVYILPYKEYKGEDGNVVFNPAHPHTEARIYVQRIEP